MVEGRHSSPLYTVHCTVHCTVLYCTVLYTLTTSTGTTNQRAVKSQRPITAATINISHLHTSKETFNTGRDWRRDLVFSKHVYHKIAQH